MKPSGYNESAQSPLARRLRAGACLLCSGQPRCSLLRLIACFGDRSLVQRQRRGVLFLFRALCALAYLPIGRGVPMRSYPGRSGPVWSTRSIRVLPRTRGEAAIRGLVSVQRFPEESLTTRRRDPKRGRSPFFVPVRALPARQHQKKKEIPPACAQKFTKTFLF